MNGRIGDVTWKNLQKAFGTLSGKTRVPPDVVVVFALRRDPKGGLVVCDAECLHAMPEYDDRHALPTHAIGALAMWLTDKAAGHTLGKATMAVGGIANQFGQGVAQKALEKLMDLVRPRASGE